MIWPMPIYSKLLPFPLSTLLKNQYSVILLSSYHLFMIRFTVPLASDNPLVIKYIFNNIYISPLHTNDK